MSELKEKTSNRNTKCHPGTSATNSILRKQNVGNDSAVKTISLGMLVFIYYKKKFPFEEIYHWLSYEHKEKFQCREFAYTLSIKNVFFRYLSFTDFWEFKHNCRRHNPIKIDIGPSYNARPEKNIPTINLKPVERELIFDIDLSDYDNVRTCCTDANICQKCWKFAATACKILDASLREDFGWQNILWVFSGRRGIHCWVCDQSARTLSSNQRKDIMQYYTLSPHFSKKIHLGSKSLYYHIRRSFDLAVKDFDLICMKEQNILGTKDGVENFLSLLPGGSCYDSVKKLFEREEISSRKWTMLCDYWAAQKKMRSEEWKKNPHLIEEIVLYYTYPRIDCDVTHEIVHLLKSPFSVHPKTLLLCIPFDPNKVDEFDLSTVPSLHTFASEIEKYKSFSNPNINVQKQRYEESVKIFQDFVNRGLKVSQKLQCSEKEEK